MTLRDVCNVTPDKQDIIVVSYHDYHHVPFYEPLASCGKHHLGRNKNALTGWLDYEVVELHTSRDLIVVIDPD